MPALAHPRIRPLRISDYREIHSLWERTEGIGLNESDSREAIGRYLRRNPGFSLVATSGGRVIATVLCGHDGRRGALFHLAVAPRWRRRGLGGRLVTSCLDKLRADGILKCNLFVFAENAAGRAFWKKLGWTFRGDLRLAQRETATVSGDCLTSC